MLRLDNIKAKRGQKTARYVGRGHGSGLGTTAGKGTKGQKARSGVSGLKKLGMRPRILQTPKVRGFKALAPKNQVVKVAQINKNFKDGDIVNINTLFKAGLVRYTNQPAKVLGKEKLTVKVKFEGVKVNQSLSGETKVEKVADAKVAK
jgi:large subunit ribosomal protein L15